MIDIGNKNWIVDIDLLEVNRVSRCSIENDHFSNFIVIVSIGSVAFFYKIVNSACLQKSKTTLDP
jgi:hypothetical protein